MSLASQSFPLDKSGITGYVYLVLTAIGRHQKMKLVIVFPLPSSIYLCVRRQDIIVLFELVVKGRDHAIDCVTLRSNAG